MPTAKIFEEMERELASIGGEKDPPPRIGRAAEFFPPQSLPKCGDCLVLFEQRVEAVLRAFLPAPSLF